LEVERQFYVKDLRVKSKNKVPRRPRDDKDRGAVILRPPKDLAVLPFDEAFAKPPLSLFILRLPKDLAVLPYYAAFSNKG